MTTDQLQAQVEYEKGKFKLLADKVKEYMHTEHEWKTYKRSYLFDKKNRLKQEITDLINPNKSTQAVMDWQAM